ARERGPRTPNIVHRRARGRSRHARGGRALSALHVALRVPADDPSGQRACPARGDRTFTRPVRRRREALHRDAVRVREAGVATCTRHEREPGASGCTDHRHGNGASRACHENRRTGQATECFARLTLSREVVTTVELELKYAGYFAKERVAADRLKGMAGYALPLDAPYGAMRTLSMESRQKLALRKPSSLAQAASIPGVSPAD